MAIEQALLAISLAQGAMGLGQKVGAGFTRRRAEREFDRYDIPPSSFAALEQARLVKSRTEIPAADLYRGKAMGQVAQAVETAQRTGTASDSLGVLDRIYGNQYMDFERDMAIKGAEMKERSRSAYMDALKYMADLETKRWYNNEYLPYVQQMNAAGQYDQAGNMNVQSAVSSGLNTFGANWEMKNAWEMWESKKAHELGMLDKQGEILKELNGSGAEDSSRYFFNNIGYGG